MLLTRVALNPNLPSYSFHDRWKVASAVDRHWFMQLAGRQHTAESAAALEVKDSVGKEIDALITVDFEVTPTLSFIPSFLLSPPQVSCTCRLLSPGPDNPVELQLQRPMAPVSLQHWEVSQAGLPGPLPTPSPRPGPRSRPRPRAAAPARGAVCKRGRVQPAWDTPGTARLQGRRDHHRFVCVGHRLKNDCRKTLILSFYCWASCGS